MGPELALVSAVAPEASLKRKLVFLVCLGNRSGDEEVTAGEVQLQ